MPPHSDPVGWYEANAAVVAGMYEAIQASELHAWLVPLLPADPSLVIDIGAGTGRDAVWLASLGHEVIAVEPSAAMRTEGTRIHGDGAERVRWVEDRLPSLAAVMKLGIAADVVLASGVWQHVPPEDRARAFRKLVSLLRSGGLLALTLRQGPAELERGMHPVSLDEIERLARDHGMQVARVLAAPDRAGRTEVSWVQVALRLPDDGTGALPLLRHLILSDAKSSTYKLGLLRALCRIADSAAGMARDAGEGHVALPLGLVALTWLRLYLPLVSAGLPQAPTNRGPDSLGFAKEGFRALLAGAASPLDLRVGVGFGMDAGRALHAALRDAADTIVRMPATYLTYPGGGPILPISRARSSMPGERLTLDSAYLWSFGELRVPRHLWRALQRFAVWVEPALIAEWERLMRSYAEGQSWRPEEGVIAAATAWSDPVRDVALPRGIALRLFTDGQRVHCVWSGARLDAATLDIDHCLPWSAWPCSDLWNLMPAHRRVNQHAKRDRLPSEDMLLRARDRVGEWWSVAYLARENETLPCLFCEEAQASLPALRGELRRPTTDDVFNAVRLQRLRLRLDQQVPEWTG